jgi:hypothetical protein
MSRRQVLAATGIAGASLLVSGGQATAEPSQGGWLGWFAANRDHVAVVIDDGQGGRVAHRPYQEQALCSAIKVVHAAGYALAVELGKVKPTDQVRVGDWESYYIGLDGGAHQASLTDLGIPFGNGVTADDPERLVTLDDLAKVAVLHSDNAAADLLRDRVGDATMRAAAVRGGWPQADARSILGEMLLLILPDRAPADGSPAALRKKIGDQLAEQARRDPQLQLEIIGRFPHAAGTYDAQRPWARQTWRGTAAGLNRIHRSIADGRFPVAGTHLQRAFAAELPKGVNGIGFKGGSLPGQLTVGFSVRWDDGRIGSAAILTEEVDEQLFSTAGDLVGLTRDALLDPSVLRKIERSLVA